MTNLSPRNETAEETAARMERLKREHSLTAQEAAQLEAQRQVMDRELREQRGMNPYKPNDLTPENYNLAKWLDIPQFLPVEDEAPQPNRNGAQGEQAEAEHERD